MKYLFYVIDETGHEMEWRGLTLKQARDMYAWTQKFNAAFMKCGWQEMV